MCWWAILFPLSRLRRRMALLPGAEQTMRKRSLSLDLSAVGERSMQSCWGTFDVNGRCANDVAKRARQLLLVCSLTRNITDKILYFLYPISRICLYWNALGSTNAVTCVWCGRQVPKPSSDVHSKTCPMRPATERQQDKQQQQPSTSHRANEVLLHFHVMSPQITFLKCFSLTSLCFTQYSKPQKSSAPNNDKFGSSKRKWKRRFSSSFC